VPPLSIVSGHELPPRHRLHPTGPGRRMPASVTTNWRIEMAQRANALADRLEQGASALETFVRTMTDADWRTAVPGDGRTVGVIVHHVASVYPLEIDLARRVASGDAVAGVTWDGVAQMNAKHALENGNVGKEDALSLLRRNSRYA